MGVEELLAVIIHSNHLRLLGSLGFARLSYMHTLNGNEYKRRLWSLIKEEGCIHLNTRYKKEELC